MWMESEEMRWEKGEGGNGRVLAKG